MRMALESIFQSKVEKGEFSFFFPSLFMKERREKKEERPSGSLFLFRTLLSLSALRSSYSGASTPASGCLNETEGE